MENNKIGVSLHKPIIDMDSIFVVKWATILSPIVSVLIAVIMIWYNNKDTKKLIQSLRKLTKTNIEISIERLDLELKREKLLAELQQSKHNYLSQNIAAYQKDAAVILKDQFERSEEPKLKAKMHQDYLAIQLSYLRKLKELEKEL